MLLTLARSFLGDDDQVSDAVDKKSGPAPPGWQHFDVELDSQKMVCRHKTGDNPFVTAQRFLDENLLDQSLLDQVGSVGTALFRACAGPPL